MAGSGKATPNVPIEVKSCIRSVLLSKPKGIKVSMLLKDYRELIGEKLMYRQYGCDSLETLLSAIPDAARYEDSFDDLTPQILISETFLQT